MTCDWSSPFSLFNSWSAVSVLLIDSTHILARAASWKQSNNKKTQIIPFHLAKGPAWTQEQEDYTTAKTCYFLLSLNDLKQPLLLFALFFCIWKVCSWIGRIIL